MNNIILDNRGIHEYYTIIIRPNSIENMFIQYNQFILGITKN